MNILDLFENLPEGFRLAEREDIPLVTLTVAQAFTDYEYPVPSVKVKYKALLKYFYELSERCAINAIENGVILTNEDFSAVMFIAPYDKRADYDVDSLYNNLKTNAGEEAAENILQIFDYILEAESKIKLKENTLFIDMFAVQTPKQGQKLGSKLMRELISQCIKKDVGIFLYTNTKKNEAIYNHFGFETVSAVHKDEINSDTYFLLCSSEK